MPASIALIGLNAIAGQIDDLQFAQVACCRGYALVGHSGFCPLHCLFPRSRVARIARERSELFSIEFRGQKPPQKLTPVMKTAAAPNPRRAREISSRPLCTPQSLRLP